MSTKHLKVESWTLTSISLIKQCPGHYDHSNNNNDKILLRSKLDRHFKIMQDCCQWVNFPATRWAHCSYQ